MHDKLFKVAAARDLVLEAERTWLDDSPFKGINKLLCFIKACKVSPAKMEWVLMAVINRCKAGSMELGEFSIRNMTGRSTGGAKQFVDIMLK